MKQLSDEIKNKIKNFQKNEITEYHIYSKLSKKMKDPDNAKVLQDIGDDEKRHYKFWKEYSQTEIKPNRLKIFFYYWIARIFGLTFGIKLMENGEENAQVEYDKVTEFVPEAKNISADEEKHEHALIALIKEEKLDHIGSVVLGLNDALVELTGALAGLSFAFQNTKLIALAGLITGIAASFSMAASEYLSKKAEGEDDCIKASVYTGIAYIITVILLVAPYFLLANYIHSLACTISIAILIIFVFNYYISVAKDLNFKKRFWEMAFVSLGVAAFSFGIGFVIRTFLGIEI